MAKQTVDFRNLFLLFCLLGEFLVLFSAVLLIGFDRRSRKEASFLPVEAVVSRVSVVAWGGGRSSRKHYTPRVRFRYTVNGVGYEAETSGRGTSETQAEAEQAGRAMYPLGKTISAFYDPHHPADAVLTRAEPMQNFWSFFFTCTGVPFLLLLPGAILAVKEIIRSLRVWRARSGIANATGNGAC